MLNRYLLHTLLTLVAFAKPVFASEGTINYEKFYRLNNPLYQSDSGDLLNLSYESNRPRPEDTWDGFMMGDLRLYFQDNNSVNYSLQELYGRYQGDTVEFSLGRRILDWNTNEKYWSLGYLNANQAFTLLSTEEEGVTGAFTRVKAGDFEFDFLLSYLFIPQLNPEVVFKNGEVKSKSDWVRMPPKRTVINGLEVPIHYRLNKVNYSRIIFNKSIGANASYKWRSGGLSGFAIYKPENRLRANASAYYDNITLNKVVVEPDPTVNHHAYYGLQLFHAFGDLKSRGGLSYVDPNLKLGEDFPVEINNARKTFKSDYFAINPRYDREAYAHLSANIDRQSYILSMNYIHLLTKNIRASDDFFSDTVKWKRAIGGSVQYFFTDSFNILFDLKYDFARFDNIIRSELAYNYQKKINVSLGLEVLKAPQDSSYWSYYRANDTLYTSLGFYF